MKDLLIKNIILAIKALWPDLTLNEQDVDLSPSEREEYGDVATTVALKLAKQAKLSPREVAEKVTEKLKELNIDNIDDIQIAGPGYINFFFNNSFLEWHIAEASASLSEELSQGWPQRRMSNNQSVIIEYPSTNIAKPMHVGHSRTSFIGDALARVYEFAGYNVTRWDYIGDWGTNFGKIIAGYKKWGNKKELEEKPIETMLALYVRFSNEAKQNPGLDEEARAEFSKLEKGDLENRELWQWLKDESLKESKRMYELLGLLSADVSIGEEFYNKRASEIVQELLDKGIAEKSEGAIVVKFENEKLPLAMLAKSDGSTLYLTRDLPNILYRIKNYDPSKILYIVSNEQALHFEQLFEIAGMIGVDKNILEHIKFGLILGTNHKKLSSRDGSAVLLEDIVKEAIDRASKIIAEKNPAIAGEERARVARAIAVGALKYNDLKEYRTGDIIFDWDRVLDFGGNSGPYLQYTYARLHGILSKKDTDFSKAHANISNKYEHAIALHLTRFDQVIDRVIADNAPHHLALYAYELANKLNSFYENVSVLKEENLDIRASRLKLIRVASSYLAKSLYLLGVEVVDRV